MISINIICLGNLKEKYLKDAVSEYTKRLNAFCKLNVTEIPEYKLPQNPSASQIDICLEQESKSILGKIPKNSYIIPLCIEGKQISSTELSNKISDISLSGKSDISLIIGSSHGLSNEIKNKADFKLSMSKMTFPHQLARVMLLEQIYRAFQISSGGKYHK